MARPRNTDDRRRCKVCGETKPIGDFPRAGNNRRYLCQPCYRAQQNATRRPKGEPVAKPAVVEVLPEGSTPEGRARIAAAREQLERVKAIARRLEETLGKRAG
jgi:transposase-like protein